MSRNWLNLLIDGVTAVVVIGLAWTGLLMEYVLPAGSGRRGLSLWGWDRHEWGELHLYLALGAIALVVIHIALHWRWVSTMVMRVVRRGGAPGRLRRNLVGGALGLLLVGLFVGSLWWASTQRVQDEARQSGGGGHRWGQMNP